MSKKIGFVVCGNSGIDYIDHPYDIKVLRSMLLFGENEYEDYVDIDADTFYKQLSENPDVALSTAQTATGIMMKTFEDLKNAGYTDIIVVTISSQLSGTYEGAHMAANMVGDVDVHVFDSLSVGYAESYMILEAARMAQEGAQVPEILDRLASIRDNQGLLISVDTLKFLVKNGRLSGASGLIGSMLKIKPLLHLSHDGRVEAIEKIRTRKKALNRLVEKFLEDHHEKDIEVFLIHANALDTAKEIREKLLEKSDDLEAIDIHPLTPVVGAHAGPGALGIGWIIKKW
ncbi:MAG: DegV family protein [Bacillota bacterium]